MQTSAERLENNVVEVSVTVDAKAVDKAIADTYKELAKKYRFPGFRPGKAPRPVIDTNIGKDAVLGQGNAGDYDYNANVAYPFGYGLSYTTFDWSNFKSSYDAATDSFNVSVDVKNTGSVAGK